MNCHKEVDQSIGTTPNEADISNLNFFAFLYKHVKKTRMNLIEVKKFHHKHTWVEDSID